MERLDPNCFPQEYYGASIRLGRGITELTEPYFRNCDSATRGGNTLHTRLYIPKSCVEILPAALTVADTLLELTVDENNPVYRVIDGMLYSKDGKTCYLFPSRQDSLELAVPEGTERICAGALAGLTGNRVISLPVSMETIEDGAFGDVSGITFRASKQMPALEQLRLLEAQGAVIQTYSGKTDRDWGDLLGSVWVLIPVALVALFLLYQMLSKKGHCRLRMYHEFPAVFFCRPVMAAIPFLLAARWELWGEPVSGTLWNLFRIAVAIYALVWLVTEVFTSRLWALPRILVKLLTAGLLVVGLLPQNGLLDMAVMLICGALCVYNAIYTFLTLVWLLGLLPVYTLANQMLCTVFGDSGPEELRVHQTNPFTGTYEDQYGRKYKESDSGTARTERGTTLDPKFDLAGERAAGEKARREQDARDRENLRQAVQAHATLRDIPMGIRIPLILLWAVLMAAAVAILAGLILALPL